MRIIRLILPILFSFLLPVYAPAHNALFTISPRENQAGGLFFHVTSKALPDTGAEFRVVITENQAKFNAYPLAEVGTLKSTKSARSISAGRKVPCTREGLSLVCVFTVTKKELADPNFCFFFTDLEHAIDEKILFALTKDFCFARLSEFAPERR
jgi:hypothetical protein